MLVACQVYGSLCKNGRCYYANERCDGINNCGDYTDELNCSSM
jgi:Low-density lipoprotein receptor domain class A